MKKAIPLSLTLLLFAGLRAQNYPMDAGKNHSLYASYYYGDETAWLRLLAAGKKIKSVETSSSKNPKDDRFLMMNEQGQVIERKEYRYIQAGWFWKNRFFHEKLEYNNGLESRVDFYDRKGKVTDQAFYEYFAPKKLKHSVFMHKGIKKMERTAEFNADSNITSFVSYGFNKGKSKQKVRYEYEYYPDKQSKETRMYNSHNKLKYTWKYDCNPKGEIKNETQICRNTVTDKRGRMVETYFSTNSKGHKTKSVHTYYIFGGKNVQVQLENYIIEKGTEHKVFEIHFADSLEKYYTYTSYDRKGRVSNQSRTEYSVYGPGQKIISQSTHTYYSRNKLIAKTEEKFNEKGMPLGSVVTNSKNKVIGRTEFSYQNDTQYSISHYNKRQKLSDTYTSRIQYY